MPKLRVQSEPNFQTRSRKKYLEQIQNSLSMNDKDNQNKNSLRTKGKKFSKKETSVLETIDLDAEETQTQSEVIFQNIDDSVGKEIKKKKISVPKTTDVDAEETQTQSQLIFQNIDDSVGKEFKEKKSSVSETIDLYVEETQTQSQLIFQNTDISVIYKGLAYSAPKSASEAENSKDVLKAKPLHNNLLSQPLNQASEDNFLDFILSENQQSQKSIDIGVQCYLQKDCQHIATNTSPITDSPNNFNQLDYLFFNRLADRLNIPRRLFLEICSEVDLNPTPEENERINQNVSNSDLNNNYNFGSSYNDFSIDTDLEFHTSSSFESVSYISRSPTISVVYDSTYQNWATDLQMNTENNL